MFDTSNLIDHAIILLMKSLCNGKNIIFNPESASNYPSVSIISATGYRFPVIVYYGVEDTIMGFRAETGSSPLGNFKISDPQLKEKLRSVIELATKMGRP